MSSANHKNLRPTSRKYIRSLFLIFILLITLTQSACTGKSTLVASSSTAYHIRPSSKLLWHACSDGHPESDCALLRVPINYQQPNEGSIHIGISRLKALDEKQRIGALFVIPGGPGSDADAGLSIIDGYQVEEINRKIPQYFSLLRKHFDIISIDQRGVSQGRGDRLRCTADFTNDPSMVMLPSTLAQYQKLVAYNHKTGVECRQEIGPLLDHVDTLSVVHDLDNVRQALGEQTISLFGGSYGTEVEQLYAEKYPNRIRAMVMDSNVNHAEFGWIPIKEEAESIEAALNYFDTVCAHNSQCQIPAQPNGTKSVLKSLHELINQAKNKQLRTKNGIVITPREIIAYVYSIIIFPRSALAFELAHLLFERDPATLEDIAREADSLFYRAVSCQDFISHPATYAELSLWIKRAKHIAPTMYPAIEFLAMNMDCVGWPIKPQNPPAPLHIRANLPILIVNNHIDPATPLAAAVSLHRMILGSILLVTNAVGHSSLGNSPCGLKATANFLYTAQLPQHDERCSD